MGLISEYIEKRTGWSAGDERWWRSIIGGKTAAGVDVSETKALQSTAVYACVKLLSETIATLPLFLYQRLKPRGKERAQNHDLYHILHDSPNPEMSSADFRGSLQGHIELWGNAYAEIEYDKNSRLRALWPLRPDRVKVGRITGKIITEQNLPDRMEGDLYYQYTASNGEIFILPSYRVFHVPGFGFTGLKGYSPIAMARQAIGLALATEEFGARFFGNGARPGGVLEHPKTLTKEAQDRLRASWNEMHQGLSNQHRIAILEEGLSYKQVGINPEDAQFLETRKFQTNEICRFFGVPPHLIGDQEKSTSWGTGIEQQNIGFLEYTLRPRLVRWEQRIYLRLIYPEDRQEYFAEHLVDGLMRGDSAARAEYFTKRFNTGSLSPNDIREIENQNPVEGGDMTFVPLNMIPIDQASSAQIEPKNSRNHDTLRQRFIKAYNRLFEDAGARILKRERENVIRMARKHLPSDKNGFINWIGVYYLEFTEYIGRQIIPVAMTLAESISSMTADKDIRQIEDYINDYQKKFAEQYALSSKKSIEDIVLDDNDGEVGWIEGLFESWGKSRFAGIAAEEIPRIYEDIINLPEKM